MKILGSLWRDQINHYFFKIKYFLTFLIFLIKYLQSEKVVMVEELEVIRVKLDTIKAKIDSDKTKALTPFDSI
jgi:hypothetical protein